MSTARNRPSLRGISVASLALLACSLPLGAQESASPPNILLVVLDDVGTRDIGCYGEGLDLPATPTIDSLADSGVLFRNAWSNPYCSPTRAGLLTGRHAFRTGVGDVFGGTSGPALALEELVLPELLPPEYATAAIGKWHLSHPEDAPSDPNLQGFDHFSGVAGNVDSYYGYRKIVDGVEIPQTTYLTTAQADDALSWIGGAQEPWFCYLAFSAAHKPFQYPPPDLHGQPSGEPELSDSRIIFKAMIEAMDAELGRLLQSFPPQLLERTTVLLAGDNGTPKGVLDPSIESGQGKGKVFEGGVNVPLIASGAGVAGSGECAALVSTNDLFATVIELAGAPTAPSGLDAVSLVPYLDQPSLPSLRRYVFTETFDAGGVGSIGTVSRAVRDDRFKLHRVNGAEALFDLAADPEELVNVLSSPSLASEANELRLALDSTLASPGLAALPGSLSVSDGGTQELLLSACTPNAGAIYLVLGSASGTSPGITIDGWVLPLNPDPYLSLSLAGAGSFPFLSTVGTLDDAGQAGAAIVLQALAHPQLVGVTLQHAFLAFDAVPSVRFASPAAAPLVLVP